MRFPSRPFVPPKALRSASWFTLVAMAGWADAAAAEQVSIAFVAQVSNGAPEVVADPVEQSPFLNLDGFAATVSVGDVSRAVAVAGGPEGGMATAGGAMDASVAALGKIIVQCANGASIIIADEQPNGCTDTP